MVEDGRESTPSYVGFKSCGCAVAAIVDTPDFRKEVQRAVSEWIARGLTVERKTVGWARKNLRSCKCAQSKQTQPELL